MKRIVTTCIAAAMLAHASAQMKPMKDFVDELMAKMTVTEKIGQLNLLPGQSVTTGHSENSPLMETIAQGRLGAVLNLQGVEHIRALQKAAVEQSRLGIPLLVGLDVVHGYETVFPIPLAMSCSWDTAAIRQSARIAAREASADGICWTFSPMVDVALDARWGRIAEGSGEDPFLGSCIARAMVEGYQGDMSRPDQIMACVKHFALYGASEAGRDYNTVDMSRVRMYNQFFPPYLAAVEAGAGSVMSSFNVIDYVPATANRWLLDDVLRQQWKFDGFVVSDYGSVGEMVTHGLGPLEQASARALKAGTDMDMCAEGFSRTLEAALKAGIISMDDIDRACRRILEAKYRLGLFEDPYRYCDPTRRTRDIYTPEHRKAARDLAAKSFVLLKNDGQLLPLKKQGTIALIGPLADSRNNMAGMWSVSSADEKYSTLRESMERALQGHDARLLYAQGCNIAADSALQQAGAFGRDIPRVDDAKAKAEALDVARQADVIVCAMGEEAEMSGESSSRSGLELFDVQRQLLAELLQLGKPVVLLHFAGRPTVLTWEDRHVPAILNVWFGGSESGDAICDVLFGDKAPSGKLTTSMPQHVGQLPLYYNHLPTGRPVGEGDTTYRKYMSNYLDVRNDPLYPFGYGLSYTTFEYGDLRLSARQMDRDGTLTATITVTNTGACDADEIVQLYIRDLEASISRPVKELKGFRRIHLAKGERKDVSFTIKADMLKFYDYNLEHVLEPGFFEVMVGPDSSNKSLHRQRFEVK